MGVISNGKGLEIHSFSDFKANSEAIHESEAASRASVVLGVKQARSASVELLNNIPQFARPTKGNARLSTRKAGLKDQELINPVRPESRDLSGGEAKPTGASERQSVASATASQAASAASQARSDDGWLLISQDQKSKPNYGDKRFQAIQDRLEAKKAKIEEIRATSAKALEKAESAGVSPARCKFWKKFTTSGLSLTVAILGLTSVMTVGTPAIVALLCIGIKTSLDAFCTYRHFIEAKQKAADLPCANNFPTGDLFTDVWFNIFTRKTSKIEKSMMGPDSPEMLKAIKWGKVSNAVFNIGVSLGAGLTGGLHAAAGGVEQINYFSAAGGQILLTLGLTWMGRNKQEVTGRNDKALAKLAEGYTQYYETLEEVLESIANRANSDVGTSGHLDDEEVAKKLADLKVSIDGLESLSEEMQQVVDAREKQITDDNKKGLWGRAAVQGIGSGLVQAAASFGAAALFVHLLGAKIGVEAASQWSPVADTVDNILLAAGSSALSEAVRKVRARKLLDPLRAQWTDPRAQALNQELDNEKRRKAILGEIKPPEVARFKEVDLNDKGDPLEGSVA